VTLYAAWLVGFPVLGFIAGLLGRRFGRVRQVLVWPAAVISVGIFVYGLFRGGPNDCVSTGGSSYACHPTAYIADLTLFGVAVIVAVTVLSLAPIAAAFTRRRAPSVIATCVLALLIFIFPLGLLPWVPAASCVLAAAIAGPPRASRRGEGPPEREPLETVSEKPRPGRG
jgi:MFS family permease